MLVSPSNGTDVLTHPIAVIKCNNQTRCIQPKLQLRGSYDVYLCKHIGQGVRFFFLAKEGLLLHPNIRLVATPEAAAVPAQPGPRPRERMARSSSSATRRRLGRWSCCSSPRRSCGASSSS